MDSADEGIKSFAEHEKSRSVRSSDDSSKFPSVNRSRLSRTLSGKLSAISRGTARLVKRSPDTSSKDSKEDSSLDTEAAGAGGMDIPPTMGVSDSSNKGPLPALPMGSRSNSPSLPANASRASSISSATSSMNHGAGLSREDLLQSTSSLQRGSPRLLGDGLAASTNKPPERSVPMVVKGSGSTIQITKEQWDAIQQRLTQANDMVSSLTQKLSDERKITISERAKTLEAANRTADAEKRGRKTMRELALATRIEPNSFDDKYFADEVRKLRSDVLNWARNQEWLTTTEQEPAATRAEKFGFLRAASSRYKDYIRYAVSMPDLMEAYIWKFFMRAIFGQSVWTVELRKGEKVNDKVFNTYKNWKAHLESNLVNPEDTSSDLLQDWRVACARVYLTQRPAIREFALTYCLKTLVPHLVDEIKGIALSELDVRTLETIIKSALELDITMQQQRPRYVFDATLERAGNAKPTFNEALMEVTSSEDRGIDGGEHSMTVNMVVRPGLWKYGSSAGKNYEQRIVILKAVVDVYD